MEYTAQSKALLEVVLSPIPFLFRSTAKKMIDKKVKQVAAEKGHSEILEEDVVHGYILASEGKDKQKVRDFLAAKGIDVTPYETMLK